MQAGGSIPQPQTVFTHVVGLATDLSFNGSHLIIATIGDAPTRTYIRLNFVMANLLLLWAQAR